MAIIFIYFALFLGVHYISKTFSNPGKAQLFQLVVCFILLFGFFGFRDITVLNDTSHYYGFYYQRAHVTKYLNETVFAYHITDKFEYGFQVLCHVLIKYVSKNPYTIIILSSLVITIGELWFFNRHSKHIAKMCFYFLIANLIFMHYCIIRQALALLLFYVAFEQMDKNIKKYHLLVACGCLFHISAPFLSAIYLQDSSITFSISDFTLSILIFGISSFIPKSRLSSDKSLKLISGIFISKSKLYLPPKPLVKVCL